MELDWNQKNVLVIGPVVFNYLIKHKYFSLL